MLRDLALILLTIPVRRVQQPLPPTFYFYQLSLVLAVSAQQGKSLCTAGIFRSGLPAAPRISSQRVTTQIQGAAVAGSDRQGGFSFGQAFSLGAQIFRIFDAVVKKTLDAFKKRFHRLLKIRSFLRGIPAVITFLRQSTVEQQTQQGHTPYNPQADPSPCFGSMPTQAAGKQHTSKVYKQQAGCHTAGRKIKINNGKRQKRQRQG